MSRRKIIDKDDRENWERVCPVCGKSFIVPPLNVYKLQIKGIVYHYCSYTCYRTIQKKRERKRK